jgi:hypothetical protein
MILRNAQVAQLAEHVLGKDEVGGSIPLLGLFLEMLKQATFYSPQKFSIFIRNKHYRSTGDGEGAV